MIATHEPNRKKPWLIEVYKDPSHGGGGRLKMIGTSWVSDINQTERLFHISIDVAAIQAVADCQFVLDCHEKWDETRIKIKKKHDFPQLENDLKKK